MTLRNIVIAVLFLIGAVFSAVSISSASSNMKELPVPQNLEVIG